MMIRVASAPYEVWRLLPYCENSSQSFRGIPTLQGRWNLLLIKQALWFFFLRVFARDVSV
jgi:hypothetical protein